MSKKWEEEIIVVPRADLFDEEKLAFQGVLGNQDKIEEIFERIEKHMGTMRRGGTDDPTPKENNAEINTDFKQPIPYAVIKRGNEVFAYERLEGGGEARLHGKISLGVGGHMNKDGDSFNESLFKNLMRELNEEVNIDSPEFYRIETVGFINDDNEEVSKVHIGMLVIINLPLEAEVTVKETDQLKGSWVTIGALAEDMSLYERLENWSQIAVDELYKHIPVAETCFSADK